MPSSCESQAEVRRQLTETKVREMRQALKASFDNWRDAFFDGVILQLFDVMNPTDPKLIHKEKIGTRGSSSEAITNHLAFNYFGERGLLAIPMTICEGGPRRVQW